MTSTNNSSDIVSNLVHPKQLDILTS